MQTLAGPFEVKKPRTWEDIDKGEHEVVAFSQSPHGNRAHSSQWPEPAPEKPHSSSLIHAGERLALHRQALLPIAPGTEAEKRGEESAPERDFSCPNYNKCLGLAAALDWHSFACANCNRTINEHLIWRARHRLRSNPQLARLFDLPHPPEKHRLYHLPERS